MNNFETVENHILSFPMEERFMLAQSLIQSLSGYYSDETEIQWMTVVDRRLREVREGKVRTIPGEEIMAEMQRLIES